MPTFGDYETVGEPVATRDERGHVSTIWKARKSGEIGASLYAVKCYTPHRKPKEGQPEDALDEDLGLEFLEGIKQLKKAHSEGGRCLAPIHAFGIAAEGAWYVTDFYPRNTLKAWIARRGGVDSAAVRHVLYSAATGCLALKRSRGYSHGNLKSGNVFLVGKPCPLRKTPLHLADPYPAAPLQLSRLEGDDRHELGALLDKVIEAHDLRAIGELILELVEGRLIQGRYDYNYPVAPSAAWDRLGKDGERWRQLCNRLLDPQLSPDKVSLESLAKEFRPNPLMANLPMILAALGVICVIGVTASLGIHFIKQRNEAREAKRLAVLEILDHSNADGNRLLEETNYAEAVVEFQKAVKLADELNDASRKKAAEEGQRYASALAQAKAAGTVEDEIKSLEEALQVKKDAKVTAWFTEAKGRKAQSDKQRTLAQKKSELEMATANANRLLAQTNYAEAVVEFQKAVKLADEVNDADRKKTADEDQRYASALAQAKAAGAVEDEIKSLEEALKVKQDGKVVAWFTEAKGRKARSDKQRTDTQKKTELDMAVANGNKLLEQTSYAQAAVEFQKAVKLAGEVNDADRKKTADEAQRYASALAQAKAAGSVEDEIKTLEEALKLKQDAKARDWLREAKDFQNADKAFTAAKYDEALKFCDTRRGTDRFVQLARKAREEQGLWNTVTNALNAGQYDALLRPNPPLPAKPPFENAKSQADEENKVLQDAQKKFSAGNYAFIGTLEGKSYKTKPPFAKLIGDGRTEESDLKSLLGLKEEKKPQAVVAGLGKLMQAVRDKTPFTELAQWAKATSVPPQATNNVPGSEEGGLDKLETTLRVYEAWFGKGPSIKVDGTLCVKLGAIPIQFREESKKKIEDLRSRFDSIGHLDKDHRDRLDAVKKAIQNWP